MYPSKSTILGEYIKQCRSRVSPHSVGVVSGKRRRVKGLRREELAEMCGISTTWVAWIEQGRSQSMSSLTLDSIAKALQLNSEERAYVFMLANLYDPYSVRDRRLNGSLDNLEQVRQVVANLNYPGFVTNRTFDILTINNKSCDIFRGCRMGEFKHERNLLAHFFLNPVVKDRIQNWEYCASRIVAKVRFSMPVLMYDSAFCDLIDRIQSQSVDFSRFWGQHDVIKSGVGVINFSGEEMETKSFTHKAFSYESNNNLIINVLMDS